MLKHSAGVNIIDATSKQLRRRKESSLDNINDTGLARRGIAAINNKEKSTKLYLIDNEGKRYGSLN
jgi:hypothetical protein